MPDPKNCLGALTFLLLTVLSFTVRAELPDFTRLVEESSPAVVNISTRQKVPDRFARNAPDLEGIPPMFREFFEYGLPQPRNPGRQRESQSLGSGFIISADGYVLTNNHVIDGAEEIIVRLSDRSELNARLVGRDPRTDVALLKIDGKTFPVVRLGTAKDLKVGEWVLAIGSPFGFDYSVTAGIVSAKGRSLPNENYVPFIQTDVAINPGNSGGPLFNLDGEVVGINSQIFTRSGGFMGLSFAIPIDVALAVADQLKATGKVSRGWMGIMIQEVSKDLAESFGLDRPAGALVLQIENEGPADKAGLQVGDVIISVDNEPIDKASDLPHRVGAMAPGTRIKVRLYREGKIREVAVQVGALPEDGVELAASGEKAEAQNNNRLGLAITALTPEQQKALGIKGGVVIREVAMGPAAMIGLRPGDVITHLNNHAVDSVAAFERIAQALPKNRSISMRFLRQGRPSFITFRLN